jgi:8-oxo-dGTP pyrophosphatase MutT (NUDIX family)
MNTREEISSLIKAVEPFDEIEKEHKEDVVNWINSGIEIFRIKKPATPLKHLVSYSVIVDTKEKKVLLFDHKKALKMLPGGGHINKDEMPFEAAKRELAEELEIKPERLFANSEVPFFVTVTETVGLTAGHIDVSLWYVFKYDSNSEINDKSDEFVKEFNGYHWLNFDEILSTPISKLDPGMHRFVKKLKKSMQY